MLKQLMKIAIGASLLLAASALAATPDIIVAHSFDDQLGAIIYYTGVFDAPPPIVVVDGAVVGRDGEHGGLDCAKTENRPVCQTLQFVNDLDACGESPDYIVIDHDGKGAHIYCAGNDGAPPPIVIVNGVVVGNLNH